MTMQGNYTAGTELLNLEKTILVCTISNIYY